MVSVSFSLTSPILVAAQLKGGAGMEGTPGGAWCFLQEMWWNSPREGAARAAGLRAQGGPAEHFRKSKFHSKTGRAKERGPALPSTGHGTLLPPPPPPTLLIKKESFSSFMSKEKKENKIVFFRVGFRPNPNASAFRKWGTSLKFFLSGFVLFYFIFKNETNIVFPKPRAVCGRSENSAVAGSRSHAPNQGWAGRGGG